MEESGPITIAADDDRDVIENMVITAPYGINDALTISKRGMKIKNVIIYHPYDRNGIVINEADDVKLENV
jgi:hypothetical protein